MAAVVAIGLHPLPANQGLPFHPLATRRTAAGLRSFPAHLHLLWCPVPPQTTSPEASSAGVRVVVALDLPSLRGAHGWARLCLPSPPVCRTPSGTAGTAGEHAGTLLDRPPLLLARGRRQPAGGARSSTAQPLGHAGKWTRVQLGVASRAGRRITLVRLRRGPCARAAEPLGRLAAYLSPCAHDKCKAPFPFFFFLVDFKST